MKKFTLYFSIVFLFCNSTSAQLYVANNSNYYVYVADNYLYVKDYVNLQGAGNLYLRNESQLLQGATNVASTNVGDGKLSVFQEGTTSNYNYNYWCSPVGNASAAVGNEPFGITMFNRPTGLITSSPANTTSGYDGISASLTISEYWIHKYLISGTYSDWIPVGAASSMNAGEGFTMKGVSGTDATTVIGVQNNLAGSSQRYDFRGKPNDGDIDIDVLADNTTLTGNPYPSAINLNMFLLDNVGLLSDTNAPTISGEAFFWESDPTVNTHILASYEGGYGTYVANNGVGSPGTYANALWDTYNSDGSVNVIGGGGSGISYKRMFCPVGQGFMVDGYTITGTGIALMKNSYRVAVDEGVLNNSQFNKRPNPKGFDFWGEIPNVAGIDYTKYSRKELPQIKINTTFDNKSTRETILAFNPNATDGYDLGIDGKAPDNDSDLDSYFPLNTINQYVISTLPFDENKRIPFAVKCNKITTFKFTVGHFVNYDLSENVYMFDKLTGEYHDIKDGFYEVTLENGARDRFEITFKDVTLSTEDADLIKSFVVYQNNDLGKLTIKNPKLMDLKSCGVYDIAGKLIFSKQKLGNNPEYSFPTVSLSDGIYIVKMNTNDNLEVAKKVIVSRK